MATNWYATENRLGVTSLMGIDSVANQITNLNNTQPIGTVVSGVDATLGTGEFIYLQGVASLAVGNVVTYNPSTGAVTLSGTGTAQFSGQPLAVALAANTSSSNYSWYQIAGAAVITKLTTVNFLPTVPVYLGGTAGQITSAANSGSQILGAISLNAATVASATTTVTVQINRPHVMGEIT